MEAEKISTDVLRAIPIGKQQTFIVERGKGVIKARSLVNYVNTAYGLTDGWRLRCNSDKTKDFITIFKEVSDGN